MPADLELLDQGSDDVRQRERENEGAAGGTQASWRLDSVNRGGPDGKGELMDAKGKVRSSLCSVSLSFPFSHWARFFGGWET